MTLRGGYMYTPCQQCGMPADNVSALVNHECGQGRVILFMQCCVDEYYLMKMHDRHAVVTEPNVLAVNGRVCL